MNRLKETSDTTQVTHLNMLTTIIFSTCGSPHTTKAATIRCVMPAVEGPTLRYVCMMDFKGDGIGLRLSWNDRLCFFLSLCFFFCAGNQIHLLLLWLYNPSADTQSESMSVNLTQTAVFVSKMYALCAFIFTDYWVCVKSLTVFTWTALFCR